MVLPSSAVAWKYPPILMGYFFYGSPWNSNGYLGSHNSQILILEQENARILKFRLHSFDILWTDNTRYSPTQQVPSEVRWEFCEAFGVNVCVYM